MQLNFENIKPAMTTLIMAFAVVLLFGPFVIERLRILKFGQNINKDTPLHAAKQGTPTMFGILIVVAVGVALAVIPALGPNHTAGDAVWSVYIVFAGHSLLGFLDDYLSIKRGRSLGLLARQKLIGQFVIASGFALWLAMKDTGHFTTVLCLTPWLHWDMGYGYYALVVVLIMAISNATNLADGLDGLAGGLGVFVALGLAWTVYSMGVFEQLPLFGYASAGACLGFLWFNAHPAKAFMGDTGSLALGAGFAAMAIVGKVEILLLLFTAVYIVEMLSVVIQVAVFKVTKKRTGTGRRVFLMAPLHHHFEKLGWPETRVVARFWILGALALAVGMLSAPYFSFWLTVQ